MRFPPKSFVAGTLVALGLSCAAQAEDAFTLPGETTFPEGITMASDGTAYVGSVYEGRIFRRQPGATQAEPFIKAGSNGLVSAIGMLLDENKGTLWVCSSDPGVGRLTGHAKPALLAFDAATGSDKGRYALPGGGFCNDIAMDSKGAVYVTDSFAPRILRLKPGADKLEVMFRDDRFQTAQFGLNGLTFTDDNTLYVVTYVEGGLYRLSLNDEGDVSSVRKMTTDRPLVLADGLKTLSKDRLLLVEGNGALTRLSLRADKADIDVVKDGFIAPTTVAVQGGKAWLVEGQLNKLFVKDGPQPAKLPFSIQKVDLPL